MTGSILSLFTLVGLCLFGGLAYFLYSTNTPSTLTPWVIGLGAAVTFIAFLGNAHYTHRSHIRANALGGIQEIRTDKDYLTRAKIVYAKIGSFEPKIDQSTYLLLVAPQKAEGKPCDSCGAQLCESVDHEFAAAADFILNQYEFLAAGARLGAIDKEMLRETLRSAVLGFACAFEDYIRYERQSNPRIWQNLVWLCAEFDRAHWSKRAMRLGPPPQPKTLVEWVIHHLSR